MKKEIYENAKTEALTYFKRAGIALTDAEKGNLEIADFRLGDLRSTGLEIVVYVNTERCCAKELVMFPGQTCPEHIHCPFPGYPGKEETFRCRFGTCYLYVAGEPTPDRVCAPPKGDEKYYTVFHQIVLRPGEQYTLVPNTPHWFQAGPEGAVVSEFSTKSYDEFDIFTDTRIKRIPVVE
jgi:ABC-type sugar transport system, auxiliary component